MKKILTVIILAMNISCTKKEAADTLVINANIYTVNADFDKAEAFAIKDGKIIGVGTTEAMQNRFSATFINYAKVKKLVPGFIDAHCHFNGLGLQQQMVELSGTKSF